ncbi:hypothetical protein CRENPOLYSF2_200006 [Crenothrix polyspora]|uniref:Uncharacterized protein n=1 Tax=Crenothrix polyspora TaxID=360316 RepID=A0A1R4H5C5_9GAMM|nr:hypothetical protein CRENPOLYSF2_200006 [Crenothrix polyspora]
MLINDPKAKAKAKAKTLCAFYPIPLLTLSEQHFDNLRKHYDAVWG